MIVKTRKPRLLVCDDDKAIHFALKSVLSEEYEMRSAYNSEEAIIIIKKNEMDLVLMDLDMRTPEEGLHAIPQILEIQSDVAVIVFSGKTDFNLVRTAMKNGAYDYVAKDSGPDELKHVFHKALERKTLREKGLQVQHEIKIANQIQLLGNSPQIQKIRKQIEKARASSAPVIIHGETGTGKEVVAKLLRKTGTDQALEPFVSVDSGTIQSSVAESILFGYEKGAFTGAEKTTRGLFEEANGGSIYFDELANMPLEIQNKLLRVIQEKEVLRIGSARPITLEFRLICATNQDLEKLVASGKFKDDLYQRLNVLPIEIPPLRERTEDIPLLLEYFAKTHSQGQPTLHFLPETLSTLKAYPFPGNVRELVNLVQYLYTMSESSEISPLDLPPKFRKNSFSEGQALPTPVPTSFKNFYSAVENFEKEFLTEAYRNLAGNISKMSTELEMDRSYLHGKLKSYGIHQSKK